MMLPPRRERIVFTYHDGTVGITRPSSYAMCWLTQGKRWAGTRAGFVDEQVERLFDAGHLEAGAVRYARLMMSGGATDAEAFEIIRDKDCAHHGTAFELWDVSEVPEDRWFRNAWRRSHNGGPIYTAMPVARTIQLEKITRLAKDRKLELRMERWRQRIRKAKTPEELKAIWPQIR